MIGYLEGRILQQSPEGILLLAGSVGYDILLTPMLAERIKYQASKTPDVCLYIYHHQTERQPKPVLIGFETLEDKAFFQTFITVDAIGPMKAVKAMTRPVSEIAAAIEKKDDTFLSTLSGIGKRTAQKIIATLQGKVGHFAGEATQGSELQDEPPLSEQMQDIRRQVADVLVEQLGHSAASAARMIKEAFERNEAISTPEELFDEIYQEKDRQ